MEQKKLDRINELARKSREVGLTEDELIEQKALRDEYRQSFVRDLAGHLDNITIVEPNGERIDLKDRRKS